MYWVGFRSANLLKVSLVTTAAMLLAIYLLALVEPTNTAEAKDSLPQNGKIVFTSSIRGIPNIYVMNADGTRQKRITDFGEGALEPAWSPDGKKIAFVISRGSIGEMNIAVLSADGTHRELQSHSYESLNPTWSPDGTKLAVSSIAAPQSASLDIYIMDSDGSNPINVTKTPRLSEQYPAFSPDGSQICFARGPAIYVMNADGSDPTPLADEHLASLGCDWSPDGTKIAFTYQKQLGEATFSHEDIYVMNADGSGQTNLTRTNKESEHEPDWSPDGTRIAFERGTNEDVDIYTMNPDGSDVAQLTHSNAADRHPDWQPLPGTTGVHQPDTGGLSLLLVASALLFSGGSLLYAGLRRSI